MPAKISRQDLLDEIHRLADEYGRAPTIGDLRRDGKYSTDPYYREFGSWGDARQVAGYESGPIQPSQRIGRKGLINALKTLAGQLGHTPSKDEMKKSGSYSITPYINEFGSWNNALQAAGLQLRRRQRVNIPEEDLISEIHEVHASVGRPPTYGEIDDYGKYSTKVYRDAFGTWSNALDMAGYDPDRLTGEQNPSWNGGKVEVNCSTCGCVLQRKANNVESSERHFCNSECQGEWLSENNCGKNNPRWSGGGEDYGPGWNDRKRRSVRKRDDFRCQDPNCEVDQSDHLERYDRRLHVHHIQPISSFEDKREGNQPDNLITLCLDCHNNWEKISPLKPANVSVG